MDGGALRCGFVMCWARHRPRFGPRLLGSRLFSPALLFGPTLFRSILVGACVAGGPVCWFGFRPERGRPRREGDQPKPEGGRPKPEGGRSEEHTSELQSLMRTSYDAF